MFKLFFRVTWHVIYVEISHERFIASTQETLSPLDCWGIVDGRETGNKKGNTVFYLSGLIF